MINKIKNFYKNKKNIEQLEIEVDDVTDYDVRVIHVKYRFKSYEDVTFKVIITWSEKETLILHDPERNIIAKFDNNDDIHYFDNEELEFFDRSGFSIDKHFSDKTGQRIEDWYEHQ